MKKIKVKFSLFNGRDQFDESTYANFLYKILKKYYEVEISDDPEYFFFHEASDDYLNYDCIKIFYTGENIHPNFNFCDYAIGFDYLTFGDRYFRFPLYLVDVYYHPELNNAANFTLADLTKKTGFCSFVYSNYLADGPREEFFNKLSAYKKVDAGGGYLNNVGGKVVDKNKFESKYKFSIAFENSSGEGYTTEKLSDALMAKTIPIYWGNPKVAQEFNEKRFINCHRYNNLDEVVEQVKKLDQDDNLYLSMVNEPVVAEGFDFSEIRRELEKFLQHIIDQPVSEAKRLKINSVRARDLQNRERAGLWYRNISATFNKYLALFYRPFKRIKYLENIKKNYFLRIKK